MDTPETPQPEQPDEELKEGDVTAEDSLQDGAVEETEREGLGEGEKDS